MRIVEKFEDFGKEEPRRVVLSMSVGAVERLAKMISNLPKPLRDKIDELYSSPIDLDGVYATVSKGGLVRKAEKLADEGATPERAAEVLTGGENESVLAALGIAAGYIVAYVLFAVSMVLGVQAADRVGKPWVRFAILALGAVLSVAAILGTVATVTSVVSHREKVSLVEGGETVDYRPIVSAGRVKLFRVAAR